MFHQDSGEKKFVANSKKLASNDFKCHVEDIKHSSPLFEVIQFPSLVIKLHYPLHLIFYPLSGGNVLLSSP